MKKIFSILFAGFLGLIARKISGIKNLHDFNCGLKAYRKAVVKNIEVYGEMHRYIPYLAKNAGFNKIGEKVVHHQARKYGSSKFMGLNRFVNGYLDLLTLWFLSTFGKKPMHVFGFLGSIMFVIGFIAAFVIGADKLWCLANHIPQRLVTDSPYFYIALTMMIIGTQLFLTGFLGDLISRSSSGITASHPEGFGAKLVMERALKDANLKPEEVDYINVHGTSTHVGDISEAKAIKEVFGEAAYKLNISSTKSMTGHLLGAAGGLEAMATILAIQNDIVPPTINHTDGDNDEEIDYKLNFTFNKAQERTVNVGISNTFGFGGHNACVVFKKYN